MECLLDRSMRRGEPVLRVGYGHRGGVSTPADGELAEYLRAKCLICLM